MSLDLKRLKGERVAKGMTQAELSKKIGMSRESYAKREAGIVNIGANELIRIAQALGYDRDHIGIFFT